MKSWEAPKYIGKFPLRGVTNDQCSTLWSTETHANKIRLDFEWDTLAGFLLVPCNSILVEHPAVTFCNIIEPATKEFQFPTISFIVYVLGFWLPSSSFVADGATTLDWTSQSMEACWGAGEDQAILKMDFIAIGWRLPVDWKWSIRRQESKNSTNG